MNKTILVCAVSSCLMAFANAAEYKLNTDVLVIGAGSAGLTAAVQSAEKGKKVILLEKNPMVGGSSQFAEGLFAVESELNRLRSDTLTKEEAFKTLMEKHFYVIDGPKTKDYVEGSGENIAWLTDHGIKFEVVRMTPWEEATWHVISDYKGTNHGAGLIKGLKDSADKLGVDTKTSTPATELIQNDKGDVIGAKAANKKGDTYIIQAKAVILASGGFGDDPKKIAEWAHRDPEGWKSSVNMNKTGDGIQMALNAGAQMGPVSFVGHLGTEGKGIKFLSDLYTTSWQPSALWVNSDGNRFANEDVAFSFSQAANAIYAQHGHYAWSIFDDSQVKYMMDKGIDSGIGVLAPVGKKLPNLQKDIDEALAADSDNFKAADSVEQLAKEIGVPEANLAAAVSAYNKGCEVQHDSQFFKLKNYMRPLNTKKLYAIKLKAYYFSSYGGLVTNRNHQVLDKNNKPIKGLYATGLEVSNMVGPTHTTWSSGHAFGFAAFSGRHAALHATENMK